MALDDDTHDRSVSTCKQCFDDEGNGRVALSMAIPFSCGKANKMKRDTSPAAVVPLSNMRDRAKIHVDGVGKLCETTVPLAWSCTFVVAVLRHRTCN
jgi:hypothetical protein